MEKILTFATEHKKALTIIYIAKHIISAAILVAIIAVLWHAYDGPINAVNSFSESVHNIAETRSEVQATAKYLNGESDDASEVPESMLETIDKIQQSRETRSQLLEAYAKLQNVSESFESSSTN